MNLEQSQAMKEDRYIRLPSMLSGFVSAGVVLLICLKLTPAASQVHVLSQEDIAQYP